METEIGGSRKYFEVLGDGRRISRVTDLLDVSAMARGTCKDCVCVCVNFIKIEQCMILLQLV